MSSNTEGTVKKKSKGRVLFTGSGSLMIDDLMKHVPEEHLLEKCTPLEPVLKEALLNFCPYAIVVCLSNESRETLQVFSVLEENPEYSALPVFAIGKQEDCDLFKRNIVLRNMQVFARPLDREAFEQALNQSMASKIEQVQKAEAIEFVEQEKLQAETDAQEKAAAAEKALIKRIERMTYNHGRKMILVVDDDVKMLNVIKLYLQDLYDITVVPSGKLALKFLSKKSADLVLLDYMMPEEDGPTVLQQIRESSPLPNIPVVFLTGVADKDMVLRGLEFRPNGYLLKPVTRMMLLEKVTEILLGLQ